MKNKIRDLLFVTVGAFIAAIGINAMFLENRIVSGGLGGLSIAINELFGWSPGIFVMIANIPLLMLCYFFLGKATFLKTVYGSLIFPVFISLTEKLPTITHNTLLASIFGGVIMGIGLGIVFLGNSSTGGTSIITQIIYNYSSLSLGVVMTIVDGIVVIIGLIAFDVDTVMFSIISLITIGYVINVFLSGLKASKNVMIISRKQEQIKEKITSIIERGVTEIPITGGFTGQQRHMIMTTLSTNEIPRLQKEIQKIDETAFVIIMPASQVMGRGFSLTKDHHIMDEDVLYPM